MTRMMPKFVVGAAIVLLTFVTGGCVSKSDYDAKVGEMQTQASRVQKDAEAKIKSMVAAAKQAAEKEQKALAEKVEGLEKDLATAKEATEKAVKDAADKADKIKTLEAQLAAAKEATAKAEQAQKDAEAKVKALEEKPTPSTPPAEAKPTAK
ncbi:MAG: hypothetical protein ACLP9L_39920 [Thermoguttaceae bacterium]